MKLFNKKIELKYQDLYNSNQNIYWSRDIICGKMNGFDCLTAKDNSIGIQANDMEHVQLVVVGSDDKLLHIARQAALRCHYPNFIEGCNGQPPINATKITLITNFNNISAQEFVDKLGAIFGNLLNYCRLKVIDGKGNILLDRTKPGSFKHYIDIDFEIINVDNSEVIGYLINNFRPDDNAIVSVVGKAPDEGTKIEWSQWKPSNEYWLTQSEMESEVNCQVDTRASRLINYAYGLVSPENVSNFNIENLETASCQATTFESSYKSLDYKDVDKQWEESNIGICISSHECAETIVYKIRSLGIEGDSDHKQVKKKLQDWSSQAIISLAKSEHARWIVERLIFGFRPFNDEEERQYNDATTNKKEFKKQKKANQIHRDICSYNDLNRYDINVIKYDIFILLAIPSIITTLR